MMMREINMLSLRLGDIKNADDENDVDDNFIGDDNDDVKYNDNDEVESDDNDDVE